MYGNNIKLLNLYNNNEIALLDSNINFHSACFDNTNQDLIFSGDEKGFLNIFDILNKEIKEDKILICGCPIYSIHKIRNKIYCCGFEGVWIFNFDSPSLTKVEIVKKNYIFTNLSGNSTNMIITLRNIFMKTKYIVCAKSLKILSTKHTQIKRRKDKIFRNILLSVNESCNKLMLYDLNVLN